MPCVNIDKLKLFSELKKSFSDEEFGDLCFSFGLELDDIFEENNRVIYKIEVPANRCELLCIEGLSHFLSIFINTNTNVEFRTKETGVSINITNEVKNIRPFCVGACLFDINITDEILASLIDFQEKLHHNICRKRTLVSIGIHDFDKIKQPFTYTALNPLDISFQALTLDKKMNSIEILETFKQNKNLKNYVGIIDKFEKFPVVLDSNGVVLSLPPVINGEVSRLTTKTRNIFIEVTATDRVKAGIVLNSIVTIFSKYCLDKYCIGSVTSVYENGCELHPDLKHLEFYVDQPWINGMMGLSLEIENICTALNRMGLKTEKCSSKDIKVFVPPNRYDIIHKFDIFEDAAIGYGFNKIEKIVPTIPTSGSLLLINRFTDLLRTEMTNLGFIEALSFILSSDIDMMNRMNLQENELSDQILPVKIDTQYESNCVRNSLIPGILKTIASNRKSSLPIKLFEVSDIVVRDFDHANKAKNVRNMAAIFCGTTSGFEHIHGILDRIMAAVKIKASFENSNSASYSLKETNNSRFLPMRCCEILINRNHLGYMGILHPNVLKNFEIHQAVCSSFEINVDTLLSYYKD